jgi:hypothetical protein
VAGKPLPANRGNCLSHGFLLNKFNEGSRGHRQFPNVLTMPLLQRTQIDLDPPNDGLQIDHGWLTTSECYYHLAKDAESGMLGAMTA